MVFVDFSINGRESRAILASHERCSFTGNEITLDTSSLTFNFLSCLFHNLRDRTLELNLVFFFLTEVAKDGSVKVICAVIPLFICLILLLHFSVQIENEQATELNDVDDCHGLEMLQLFKLILNFLAHNAGLEASVPPPATRAA